MWTLSGSRTTCCRTSDSVGLFSLQEKKNTPWVYLHSFLPQKKKTSQRNESGYSRINTLCNCSHDKKNRLRHLPGWTPFLQRGIQLETKHTLYITDLRTHWTSFRKVCVQFLIFLKLKPERLWSRIHKGTWSHCCFQFEDLNQQSDWSYLRETLHGSDKKNDIFNEVWNSHPELPEVVGVFRDSLLLNKNILFWKSGWFHKQFVGILKETAIFQLVNEAHLKWLLREL